MQNRICYHSFVHKAIMKFVLTDISTMSNRFENNMAVRVQDLEPAI